MTRSIIRCTWSLALPLSMWSLLGSAGLAEKPRTPLIKLPVTFGGAMENTPFVFADRPLLALNYRDDTKHNTDGYKASMYLFIRDLRTGQEIARFGEGHSFVNAFVNEAVAGAIKASQDYSSGLMVAVHNLGEGRFVLSTLRIRENLDLHPAAERLLRNMLRYAARDLEKPVAELPLDFEQLLKAMGFRVRGTPN